MSSAVEYTFGVIEIGRIWRRFSSIVNVIQGNTDMGIFRRMDISHHKPYSLKANISNK